MWHTTHQHYYSLHHYMSLRACICFHKTSSAEAVVLTSEVIQYSVLSIKIYKCSIKFKNSITLFNFKHSNRETSRSQ